ncbi:MAG: hypothetical protein VB086_09060 [Clostridiaceae bacterium]|nr:hypothetical protein [Clostridiaceae bacterium]
MRELKTKHHREIEWSRLDNASKMFPSTRSATDPKVFRLCCELRENVDPDMLQKALDITIQSFPLYRSVLRRGVFWYYLESSELHPSAREESDPVCAPIYLGVKSNLLFRVSYYKNRINLEIFHVLSDGADAIRFMRALIYHYLTLFHPDILSGAQLENEAASVSERMDDSYKKHYVGGKPAHRMSEEEKADAQSRIYRIKGTPAEDNQVRLIEGSLSVRAALSEAHKYHTTLTVFIASLLIYSIYQTMPAREKKRRIVLTVPVDLRQYFPSLTARNFFSSITVGYRFEADNGLAPVIESVGESFRKYLTAEQLNYRLCKFMATERNPFARVLPLPIKDLAIRAVAKSYDRHATSSISNIGKIILPSEFDSCIRQFGVYTSVGKPQITLCSYNDRLVIGMTSPFRSTELQRTFFQMLSGMGIEVEIASNF